MTDRELFELISSKVDVDFQTGILTWKANVPRFAGKQVGCKAKKGYFNCKIGGVKFILHHIIWLLAHGYLPHRLDHINKCLSDNRLENLREVEDRPKKEIKRGRSREETFTADYIRSRFAYNREEGLLIWKPVTPEMMPYWYSHFNNRFAGKVAGSVNSTGYVSISVDSVSCLAHRLIWLIEYGYVPRYMDHSDCIRTNNRLDNLREASMGENARNRHRRSDNTSGHKGVWKTRSGKWAALITHEGVKHQLGTFANKDLAIKAYAAAADKLHREFARME